MSKKDVETKKTKIMVFGTFDGLHEGHINFFKQAKGFTKNSSLIVSIARDKNVLKIKGEQPSLKEKERLALVGNHKLVDQVILSGAENHIPHIVKVNPDIIALGYDQKAYVKNLKKDLKNKGVLVKVVRLKPYKEHVYKNHLLKIK
jgi:FAD synthetase